MTRENATAYETLLRGEILPAIAARLDRGYGGARVFRRELIAEVEFLTILEFDSYETIRAFAGDDLELAHVPAKARAVLSRFDERAQHYAELPLA